MLSTGFTTSGSGRPAAAASGPLFPSYSTEPGQGTPAARSARRIRCLSVARSAAAIPGGVSSSIRAFRSVGGTPYRFVNTHLETRLESFGLFGRYYQTAQAYELRAVLGALQLFSPNPRQIVVGDFNSDPRDVEEVPGIVPPYQIFSANHTDVWTRRPGTATAKGLPLLGLTCCQDEDLGNLKSGLYERVDLIFSLAPPKKVQDARVLGDSVSEKTRPISLGVWPSDHASVATKLSY